MLKADERLVVQEKSATPVAIGSLANRLKGPLSTSRRRSMSSQDNRRVRMPKQSRQQEIEGEGRSAFADALPGKWIVRPIVPDYGIDDQVEIFDDAGNATGRGFLVQNKATDEPDLQRALALRLKLTTVAYFNEQDLPILLVRYHVPTHILYARWFHSFGVHPQSADQKSITYRLTEQDRWNERTPVRLAAEVERWRNLRLGLVQYPLALAVNIKTGIGELTPANIVLRLKTEAAQLDNLVEITTTEAGPTGIPIVIDNSIIHINQGSSPSLTIHHEGRDYLDSEMNLFVADFFCSLGYWFDLVGQDSPASYLISRYWRDSFVLMGDSEAALLAAALLIRNDQVATLIEMIDEFEQADGEGRTIAQFLQSILVFAKLSPSDASTVLKFLRRQAQAAAEAEDSKRARTAYYNLGAFLRAQTKYREAIEAYRRAAEWDPSYHQRDYYCAELGECYFHLGHFKEAVALYEKVLEVKREPLALALYGDALMSAGRYLQARDAFGEYLEVHEGPTILEFALKLHLLNQVVDAFGEHQNRRIEEAQALSSAFDTVGEKEEITELIQKTIKLDALCPSAHYNQAILHKREERLEDARDSMAFAAVLNLGDLETWTKAVLLSLEAGSSEEDPGVILMIFMAAYRASGPLLIEELRNAFKDNDEMLTTLAQIVEAIPSESLAPPTIRLLSEGPSYEILSLALDEEHVE